MKQRNIEKIREGDYRRIDSNDTVSTTVLQSALILCGTIGIEEVSSGKKFYCFRAVRMYNCLCSGVGANDDCSLLLQMLIIDV